MDPGIAMTSPMTSIRHHDDQTADAAEPAAPVGRQATCALPAYGVERQRFLHEGTAQSGVQELHADPDGNGLEQLLIVPSSTL